MINAEEDKARLEYRAFVKRESQSKKQIVTDVLCFLGIHSEGFFTKVIQRVKRLGMRLYRFLDKDV